MISHKELSELGSSLATGFRLDRVVRALARIERTRVVGDCERADVEFAKELLAQIRRGEKSLEEGQFHGESADSALAFDRAAEAMSLEVRSTEAFEDAIGRLSNTVDLLAKKKAPSRQELSRARLFFSLMGRRALLESQNAVSRAEPGFWVGTNPWQGQPPGEAT